MLWGIERPPADWLSAEKRMRRRRNSQRLLSPGKNLDEESRLVNDEAGA